MSADVKEPKKAMKTNNLITYDQVVVNLPLASRPSTHPSKTGKESFPTHAEVVKIKRQSKVNAKNAELDNRHRIGLAITEPGTPNHVLMLIPAGKVQPGQRINVTMDWKPLYSGSDIVDYDRNITFNV